ncbi:MAG TPA: hypothetical protein VM243_20470 [Phycisphaerae bacterium]|nr:hypothetical protein [Phycisphaerae bacterium]
MKRSWLGVAIIGLITAAWGGAASAQSLDLSIHDVQFTADPGGVSPYNGQTHNVLGGIVTHVKPWGSKPRVYIQDPLAPAWGGILVKDWTAGGLAQNVAVGDRIDLSEVLVEEASGTTTLQFGGFLAPNATFTVMGTAPVPDALVLTSADLAAPVYDPINDTWFVANYDSEPYEGMLATLPGVDVGTLGLGKAEDNYELLQGGDAAWAADFMNWDAGGPYHPNIYAGARLAGITGVVEQYVGTDDAGTQWDYYQLFTRSTDDIVPLVISLSLDVKPGACPNPLNRIGRGVLPAALLGTDDFDVATIDVSSVLLARADGIGGSVAPHEGPPGPHSVFQDVATPFDGDPCGCHNLEGDGIVDLAMKFRTRQVVTALLLNDVPAGDTVELVVTGTLLDGTAFEAHDCVTIVPRQTKIRWAVRR